MGGAHVIGEARDSCIRLMECAFDARGACASCQVGIGHGWMHFFFSIHIHHALRVSKGVRGTRLYADVDVTFVRIASSLRWCRPNATLKGELRALVQTDGAAGVKGPHGQFVHGELWEGMPHRLCAARGEVQCGSELPVCVQAQL